MDKSKTKKRFNELCEETVEQKYASFFKTLKEKEFELLNKEETQEAKDMIWEEKETFSLNEDDIGRVPDLQLHLQTTDEVPVQKKYNSIPKHLYNDVKDHIQMMLDKNWIEKSSSSWSSPETTMPFHTWMTRLYSLRQLQNTLNT